ncbi:molybdenum cofactor guanylyltransferase [Sphingomonas sp. BK580]|uniref:molybdenum cofactor guanylyltransferase n=1 Tax=Sphingomonas sp. BK580 TaxID=2586972 RepID=UPI001622C054|nr:molybdenum cofactor guanylyltransferase [Sphingomonas sp. BK580]MBB3693113.1 molybdopterin-guanine dinucleotide biosynthesis protein A [Sphingomonas sp. BK580]
MTRILGAVLAGGQARRFGSDKALAPLDGTALLDHALASLAPHVSASVVVGRGEAPVPVVRDRPHPGLGPLGGIAGALAHAAGAGFDAVLTTACDTPMLPESLVSALRAAGAAHAAEAPTVGYWPVTLAEPLAAHLAEGGERSIRRWAARAGVVPVCPGLVLANVNTPDDLIRLASGSAARLKAPRPHAPSPRPDRSG